MIDHILFISAVTIAADSLTHWLNGYARLAWNLIATICFTVFMVWVVCMVTGPTFAYAIFALLNSFAMDRNLRSSSVSYEDFVGTVYRRLDK